MLKFKSFRSLSKTKGRTVSVYFLLINKKHYAGLDVDCDIITTLTKIIICFEKKKHKLLYYMF